MSAEKPESRYRIDSGKKVRLSKWDAGETRLVSGREEAEAELIRLREELKTLQETLYAGHKHSVLVILQAMDTGGKDGVIRHVFEGVNPQGVRVTSFKKPTQEELDHDFLWRLHWHAPGKGDIAIWNRSHYEDVLIVRVHGFVPEEQWSRRYEHIARFEKMLADEGTTILKFFLHMDRDEQKKRLQARLQDPEKHWKFNASDLDERKYWKDYQEAYEAMLEKTSTDHSPWFLIPANKKWYRNFAVASILVDALKALKLKFPKPSADFSKIKIV